MTKRMQMIGKLSGASVLVLMLMGVGACEPSIRVKIDPITIYAKLDVNVKVQLDKDVKDLAAKNPDLF